MTSPDAVIDRLLAEAADLPEGPAKVDLIAEAARVADVHGDARRGFAVRKELLSAALDGGQPDQLTVAFTWCLAQSDADPDAVPPDEILWQYRWVVSNLPQFPQVPRAQIEDAIADMTRRYREAGSTMRAVHLLRVNVGIKLKEPGLATAALDAFRRCPRDRWSDNPRTEQSFLVDYLTFVGRDQDAVDHCPQVLAGRVDSAHFFGGDSAQLLAPLLNLGRAADAARVQRSGYRYVARRHRYLDMVGLHIECLARLDHFPAAAKAFEENARLALDTKQVMDRFDFFWGALVLVERMRRRGHEARFRLPKELPADAGDLAAWLRTDAGGLAERFDARNGNTYFADRLKLVDDLAARPAAT